MLLFPHAMNPAMDRDRFFTYRRVRGSLLLPLSILGAVAGISLAIAPVAAQELPPASASNAPASVSPPASGAVSSAAPGQDTNRSGTEKAQEDKPKPEGKVDADAGSQKPAAKKPFVVSGLLHTWYGNGLGDTLGGAPAGFPTPQGRNYGTGGKDAFRFRRAQVALSGDPADRLDYRVMFDVAAPNLLQDAWVGYQLGRHARIELGRQKTGLSEEGSRPDDQLLTIARSVMNEDLPVKASRVGDLRATGAALRFRFTGVHGFVGVWNSLGDTNGLTFGGDQKFLDGAVYAEVVQDLTLGIWGGRSVGGSGSQEDRERVGGTLLYRSGRHFLEAEIAYTRDYAAGAPAPGKTGSLGRGGYILYGYRLAPQWQIVGRYDNWDPAKQTVFTGVATTESGVLIPRSNHKLREYTFGVNYTVPHRDARVQFNYIREDTEQNGGTFFGVPRSLMFVNLQLGYDSPYVSNKEPEKFDLDESSHRKKYALQNAIRLGLLTSPSPGLGIGANFKGIRRSRNPAGLALGADFTLPKAKLLPYAETRLSADLLAPFDVPSFLGLPLTQATITLDQVFAAHPHSRGLYGGFGIGPYFGLKARPGGKLFLGDNLSSTLGIELTVHFTGLPDPRYTLQVRFPL
jgi:hypothetical protein